MKAAIPFTILLLLSLNIKAGPGEPKLNSTFNSDKYCAKLVDGKLTVMHEGVTLTSDVTLDNGTRIKVDGTVVSKDGNIIKMKEGECYDKEGKKRAALTKKTRN